MIFRSESNEIEIPFNIDGDESGCPQIVYVFE